MEDFRISEGQSTASNGLVLIAPDKYLDRPVTPPVLVPSKREHSPETSEATSSHSSSPTKGVEPPKKYTDKLIPLQELWIQTYGENGKPKAERVDSKKLKALVSDTKITIYLPICLDNPIYEPANFERLLKGVLQQFKGRSVHFAILVTDELNRHNIAKEAAAKDVARASPDKHQSTEYSSPSQSAEGSSDSDESLANKSPKNCLSKNLDFSQEALDLGQAWLDSVKLNDAETPETEKRLNCKITVFRWREVINTENFRAHFCKRMGIEVSKNPSSVQENTLSAAELAKWVQTTYATRSSFSTALSTLLVDSTNKDAEHFGPANNFKFNRKCNQDYIFEEIAAQIRVLGTVGDLIHLFIHPEQLKIKNDAEAREAFLHRTSLPSSIEWLDWWTREILSTKTGIDFKKLPGLYYFLSAGHFPDAVIKSKSPLKPKRGSDKKKQRKEAALNNNSAEVSPVLSTEATPSGSPDDSLVDDEAAATGGNGLAIPTKPLPKEQSGHSNHNLRMFGGTNQRQALTEQPPPPKSTPTTNKPEDNPMLKLSLLASPREESKRQLLEAQKQVEEQLLEMTALAFELSLQTNIPTEHSAQIKQVLQALQVRLDSKDSSNTPDPQMLTFSKKFLQSMHSKYCAPQTQAPGLGAVGPK